ncbi:hypothetical protein [Massilia genomosp. 1]|uniref:Peptidase C1A papain C-terminal domain-containing protein n=1 Tax=Massilia genomosp. 1 TaxID=2609280 RepID=A0ABX0MW71_9BURK|nr:hypothetical protein [Massilia genomosp. 1]NHZ67006.1 hypothetical protein [Massilia genomosp. 1]
MSILFNVAPVGAKNDDEPYSQRGPTCWYYAAKMLVALHNLRSTADFEKQWKALHQLRKTITNVAAPPTLADQHNDHKHLHDKLKAESGSAEGYINMLIQLRETHGGTLPSTVAKAFYRDASKDLKTNFREYEHQIPAVTAAYEIMKSVTNTQREHLLEKFLPHTFKASTITQADCTLEKIEERLKRGGPFYASGELWSHSKVRTSQSVDQSPSGGRAASVAALADHSEASLPASQAVMLHAVVIVGIIDKSLLYKDPHDSAELRMISFEAFKAGWVQQGSCRVIDVVCTSAAQEFNDKGGCSHTANALVKLK